MSADAVKYDSIFTLADLGRETTVSGYSLSGTVTFDATGFTQPSAIVVITGSIPPGLTITTPLNMPSGSAINYYFEDPVNTPTFSGYTVMSSLPTHESGKPAFYQAKYVNGTWLLMGTNQGGQSGQQVGGGGIIDSSGANNIWLAAGTLKETSGTWYLDTGSLNLNAASAHTDTWYVSVNWVSYPTYICSVNLTPNFTLGSYPILCAPILQSSHVAVRFINTTTGGNVSVASLPSGSEVNVSCVFRGGAPS